MTFFGISTRKYGCKFSNTVATRYFGRFIPDHFAVTPGTFNAACTTHPAATTGYTPTDFTYFGQDGFTTVFTLTAQNASNATTLNYAGNGGSSSWAKLPLTVWGAAPASASSAGYGFAANTWLPSQPAGVNIAASDTAPTATNSNTWLSGSATITAKHKIAPRPANPVVPTTVNVTALPVDSDGVTATTAATLVTATPLRYGRLSLQNTSGSELLALSIPVEAQYWNGSYYIRNADDSCTGFSASSIIMGNYLQNLSACETQLFPAGSLTLSGGAISRSLTVPGFGNTGSVDVTVNVGTGLLASPLDKTCVSAAESNATAASMTWFGPNPAARATFGIYTGNSQFIYIRELY